MKNINKKVISFLFLFGVVFICLFFAGYEKHIAFAVSDPTIDSVSPLNLVPGNTIVVTGNNLTYSDAVNSKVCFNDTNTSCVNASDAVSWDNNQIVVNPTIITDFYGIIILIIDGKRTNGPFYYLKPIIDTITINNDTITITPKKSFVYGSFLAEIKTVIINNQEILTSGKNEGVSVVVPESLKNIGNATVKVKNLYGIESDSEVFFISTCSADIWNCGDWQTCSSDGKQNRVCTKTYDCLAVEIPLATTTQSCEYTPPTCASWTYSDWSSCLSSGTQTRSVISSTPSNCIGGNPILSQNCNYIAPCTSSDWSCGDYGSCSSSGTKNRICNKISNCTGGVSSPAITQTCSYIPPTPICTTNDWSCSDYGSCSSNGTKNRTCNKISNCTGGVSSPTTSQSCYYTPPCNSDTWTCGNWGSCSPQGIQTKSCTKTYDCPSAETPAPATSQYCEAPNVPVQQTPSENLGIVNQDSIIKATVKLICPFNQTMASQGSGTVIDSAGTILTNKHVVDGTVGCLVGFIDTYGDEPYFNDRQIADIYKVSNDADIAILKIRNLNKRNFIYTNITSGNSNNLTLGNQMTTYGYPAKFGTKITYTSGDFSGVDGNYLKTTAVIEHGNSGGGAYLKNGTFVGIPTAVIKGELNSMGYVLSINKINSWLNNSPIAYNNNGNNNYSRVSSILEDIDLNTLNSLDLYIAENQPKNNTIKTEKQTESQNVVQEEKDLITKIDKKISKRMSGGILLQVEKNGEGWYVSPDDQKKYYLGRPTDAFDIMRKLGLGVKHDFITTNTTFPTRVLGKILIDVEDSGKAYYIYPKDKKAYYLGRPDDAFKVMRELGLGITNSDIRKIEVGEVE